MSGPAPSPSPPVDGAAQAVADATAAAAGPPSSVIAAQFVTAYYQTLNKAPQQLKIYYGDDSGFVRMDHKVTDSPPPAAGHQSVIDEQIRKQEYRNCRVVVETVSSQYGANGSVLVLVTGRMSNNSEPFRPFVQSFILAHPTGDTTHFYVRNDILRYTGEAVEEVTAPSPSPATVAMSPQAQETASNEVTIEPSESVAIEAAEAAEAVSPAPETKEPAGAGAAKSASAGANAEEQEQDRINENHAEALQQKQQKQQSKKESEDQAKNTAANGAGPTKGPIRKSTPKAAAAAKTGSSTGKTGASSTASAGNIKKGGKGGNGAGAIGDRDKESAPAQSAFSSWAGLFKGPTTAVTVPVPEMSPRDPAASPAPTPNSSGSGSGSGAGVDSTDDKTAGAVDAGETPDGNKLVASVSGRVRYKAKGQGPFEELAVFVSNVPADVKEGPVRDTFSKFGQVTGINLFPGKTFCFVNFTLADAVDRALEAGINREVRLGEQLLAVDRKRPPPPRTAGGASGRGGAGRGAGRGARGGRGAAGVAAAPRGRGKRSAPPPSPNGFIPVTKGSKAK